MTGRLQGKVAIVVGAGQTPGETIGNGRAIATRYAREGARLLLVDRNEASVLETVEQIRADGGEAEAFVADACQEEDCAAVISQCLAHFGQIDNLTNVVGIGRGDTSALRITEEVWDTMMDVNLKSCLLYTSPSPRDQRGSRMPSSA